MDKINSIIAVIPARGGSKRISRKNIKLLNGKPLIAYTIFTALECKIFDRVIVSTEDSEIAQVALEFGAEVPGIRPLDLALDSSEDIHWLKHLITNWLSHDEKFSDLCILRPTNPLRTAGTIKNAVSEFNAKRGEFYSLRAMQEISEHPGKMWRINPETLNATPYLTQLIGEIPTHSRPTQSLEKLFIQNASLEIVSCKTILEKKSISGDVVSPFFMPNMEGFDLNTELNWNFLSYLLASNPRLLPAIK